MLSHSSAMMSSAHGYTVIDDHARNLLNDTERGELYPYRDPSVWPTYTSGIFIATRTSLFEGKAFIIPCD